MVSEALVKLILLPTVLIKDNRCMDSVEQRWVDGYWNYWIYRSQHSVHALDLWCGHSIEQTVEANVCCRGGRDDFRPAGSEYVYLSYAPCLLLLQLSNVSLFSLDVGHISPVVYGKINFNFIVMLGLFLRSPWRSSSGQHVTWLLVMISLYKRKQMRPDRKQLIHSWNIQKEPESSWQLLKSDN